MSEELSYQLIVVRFPRLEKKKNFLRIYRIMPLVVTHRLFDCDKQTCLMKVDHHVRPSFALGAMLDWHWQFFDWGYDDVIMVVVIKWKLHV